VVQDKDLITSSKRQAQIGTTIEPFILEILAFDSC
jgi:hypothetical protein